MTTTAEIAENRRRLLATSRRFDRISQRLDRTSALRLAQALAASNGCLIIADDGTAHKVSRTWLRSGGAA